MVYRIEKTTRTVIYLKKAILIRSGSTKNYPIRNIKCTGKEEKINSLREGMHVRLEGMLVLPELPRNPGQFNRRIYESGKKIDFYLENPTVLEVKEQRSGVREVVEIWKTEMMNRCEKIYQDEEAGILEAMLFGEKSELSGDIKELYQAAGISHVLVISGLHISLLALAVAGILRRLGFPMPVWVMLSVGVLAGYGILIGQPTTAVRALLMFFVLQGARLLGRSYDLLSALAFSGILMLLDNPDLILDGGCRLSFCAVIGVGWYVSEKNKIFRSIGEKEKRKNRGKGGKGSSAGAILENIRAGWYLWLFTLPVMLDTFYQVSVVGILWNLVAIPLLPVIIASGGLGVVLAGWNIFLGSLAGSPAYGMLQLYQEIGNISEKLPVGMWTPGQPSKPVIAGYYLVIFLLVLVEKQLIKREKRWKIRKIYVMNPIRFTNIRRNEVKSKILCSDVRSAMQGTGKELYLATPQQIVQRAAMVLQDVHYVIEAEFEMTDRAAPSDNPGKFQDIVTRRMSRGQCFHTPYLGCREFPAAFRTWPGGPIPTIEETRDLGFMIYDFDYTDPQNITPMYFHAKLEHGVLNVADCEVYR